VPGWTGFFLQARPDHECRPHRRRFRRDDTIRLENAIFAKLAAGTLASGSLRTGPKAADSNDYVLYDAATGALSYDADGSGGGAAVKFAQLATGLALTSADILVI
jgi:Ca2+-binding RTX toxin-like protein